MKTPALIALTAALSLMPDLTSACRMAPCRIQEPSVVLESAEVLFRGRLVGILTKSGRQVTPLELIRTECCVGEMVFEVGAAWRGVATSEFRVQAAFQNGGNCARTFYLEEEYVVWSFSDSTKPSPSSQRISDDLPVIQNCHAVGRGGWPESVNTDVDSFSTALGPARWQREEE